ncbi:TIGR04500 family putative peptide maturation system protein [Acrocarpospora catenulata]|uniref:TIGR04500 family putative peptide maturation system protein n=1 Tax=Acrocarpospora catenulata TaxID=2836182 RepID=UPI001BD9D712|nr:TIGR04500 family putative peptide maturation system protein [Acrocarpospora catenulata]
MLSDALDTLRDLAGTDPAEASDHLRRLRERHPDVRFRLLCQREEYDGSRHYDLLIKRAGEGTVSLSWCPEQNLPWPLRGVHRASELLLLRIDGVGVTVADAVARLDFLWDEARLMDRIVTATLLQAELTESPVELTDDELQEAVDAFRRARGLLTVEQTRAWMDQRCLTDVDLAALVAGEAAAARVRERVTAGRVESYFAEHQAEFGAVLDDETRRRVERRIFDEWLAERRRAAKIEWFWGTTARTGAL